MGKSELRLRISSDEKRLLVGRLREEFDVSDKGFRHVRVRNPQPDHPMWGLPLPVGCFCCDSFYLVNTGVEALGEYHGRLRKIYKEVTGRDPVEE
ncbi:hypothetical protein J4218_01995 [Candidatus Pacearchaeota archaeon]|nr:hypothetical protein [uncultured archaeon]AQS29123.1 hypothetical protein [uncultured archaeon]MBS3078869.1 hypothetical protein [Candidatus Pacearchaeota archaeon]